MKPATKGELAAVLWTLCTQGMKELREVIGVHVAGYEKQTLFGPDSRFFESATLHLCLAMAAISGEPELQGSLFSSCIDHVREAGGTMYEIQNFLGMVNERKVDYTAAMQRRQEGDEDAFFEELVEHLVSGGTEDRSVEGNVLLHMDCDNHVDAFLPRCVELRAQYSLIPG